MFPAFTGSSRRPRNVNLSGQQSLNPFTATSWAPSASSGASKSVADAQADRRLRQLERDRLKAAQSIQRSWRGHWEREELRKTRREAFDKLYKTYPAVGLEERITQGFPLLLALFQAGCPDDYERLAIFTKSAIQVDFKVLFRDPLLIPRVGRYAQLLLMGLRRHTPSNATLGPESFIDIFVQTLLRIFQTTPRAMRGLLREYYSVLGALCQNRKNMGCIHVLRTAVLTPINLLDESNGSTDYTDFAWSFLTLPDLVIVEENISFWANSIDTTWLAEGVLGMAMDAVVKVPRVDLVWLLSHFIAIQRAKTTTSLPSTYLRGLYMLLSLCSTEISSSFTRQGNNALRLPPYVADQVISLVDKNEISGLLERFTSNHAGTSEEHLEGASLLAGYTLALIRCFPNHGDEIRMRLYLADISTASGRISAVRFFWNAMSRTKILCDIVADEARALDILLRKKSSGELSRTGAGSLWDREWRTVLLFLELYTFVLRITDDEDFFNGMDSPIHLAGDTPRLRSCSLASGDLKRLTTFLKHLGFTLYYNSAELLAGKASAETTSINGQAGQSSRRRSAADSGHGKPSPSFNIVPGIDLNGLRTVVGAAMQMLYERDSRRTFLPQGHWLMTSKFDMDGFLSAVVLEEQRQQELRDAEDDESESSGEDDLVGDEMPAAFTFAARRRSYHARMEMMQAKMRKTQRERTLAEIGPKLEILRNMPFVIPFEMRVQIFRQFVHLDKYRRRNGHTDPDQWRMWFQSQNGSIFDPRPGARNRHHATIKRGSLFQDAMNQFYELGEGLKEPIQITFVDKFGQEEAGIDGGGVTKEFLISVTREAFTDEQHHLFTANEQNSLYPNPSSLDQTVDILRSAGYQENDEHWRWVIADLMRSYEFLGRVVGKCMYEGILIDISFAGFFLLKWASSGSDTGYRATVNDLREMDEQLYQGLLRLKNYPGDVSDLDLDFTINDRVSPPEEPARLVTRNLMPDGDRVPVTNENRPLYISYVARHRLVAQPYAQTRAFLRGLGSIIQPSWLSMFNQSELQRLIGGDSSEIDVEDLRANTVYSGLYAIGDDGEEHPTIQLFWEVMHELPDRDRRDVLKYVTSTPRAPLLGFSQLNPAFSIRDGGHDQERLPSASTCVNLLKLPQYTTAAALKSKLLYAVTSGAGFDLS